MSMQKSYEVFGANHNIMRNGLHFTNVALEVDKNTLQEETKGVSVVDGTGAKIPTGRKIIPAGTVVTKAGAKATGADAYGVVYENIDVTYEQAEKVFVPVVIHGVIDERLMPGGTVSEEIKTALAGRIIFTDGE